MARSGALLLGFLVLGTVLLPVGGRASGALEIFLYVEERPALAAGNPLNVTLWVFFQGAPATPDTYQVTAGLGNATTPIALAPSALGVYRGVYILEDRHIVPLIDQVPFDATAALGKDTDTATTTVRIIRAEEVGEVDVRIALDEERDWTPVPGDTIEFTARVMRNTTSGWQPHVPERTENFTILYCYASNFCDTAERIPPAPAGTGVYRGTHLVAPAALDLDFVLVIRFQVVDGNRTWSARLDLPVDFMQVWARDLRVGTDTLTMDLCIATMAGRPAAGALVTILTPGSEVGATDSEGTLALSIPYTPGPESLTLRGEVSLGSIRQRFLYHISLVKGSLGGEPEPVPDRLNVLWYGENNTFEPGDLVRARYKVWNGTALWAGGTVHYYGTWHAEDDILATRLEDVLFFGSGVTDTAGNFTFTFTAPAKEGIVQVTVRAPTGVDPENNDNLSYATTFDLIPIFEPTDALATDEEVQVSVGEFLVGQPTAVSSTISVDGNWATYLTWNLVDRNWSRLTNPTRTRMTETSPGRWSGSFAAPACLPADGEYVIQVDHEDPRVSLRPFSNVTYVRSGGVAPPAAVDWILVGGFGGALVAAVAVAYLVVRRRRRRDESGE